ncbi:hypothetical protein CK203_085363 [Vitis vinifera]|uniref:Uncharacterized protein n=1 Tax=Vitis vinifera TaxID=29760 RepID=A0A438DCV9_VITVI|nr:hypothetical protein CK203_085363 [Vitis vinifera]
MRRFSEVIDELHLKDLPLFDGKYTWSGGSNNSLAFKLNYFLVFDDWEGQFNGLVQKIMANPVFDHTPIMLDGGGIRNGKDSRMAMERDKALTAEELEVKRRVVDEFKNMGNVGGDFLEAEIKRVVAKGKG